MIGIVRYQVPVIKQMNLSLCFSLFYYWYLVSDYTYHY